jgi:hypothetical protein
VSAPVSPRKASRSRVASAIEPGSRGP